MYVVLKKGYTKNEAKMQSRCQELKNKQDMECWSRKTTDRKEERVERREGKKMGGNCGLSNCKAAGVELSKHNEPLVYHYEPGSQIRIYKILAFAHLGLSLTLVPPTF